MKTKIFLFIASFMAIASFTTAQTTFTNRNNDERLANRITTTDSAYHYIDSITVSAKEIGMVQATVIGFAKDTAYGLTGIKQARYRQRSGTLTLGAVTAVQDLVVDTPLGTSTFDIVAVGTKVYIRIKGKDGLSITWTSLLKKKSTYTNL